MAGVGLIDPVILQFAQEREEEIREQVEKENKTRVETLAELRNRAYYPPPRYTSAPFLVHVPDRLKEMVLLHRPDLVDPRWNEYKHMMFDSSDSSFN